MSTLDRPQHDRDHGRLFNRISAISAAKAPPAPKQTARTAPKDNERCEPREPTYRFARVLIGRQAAHPCIVRDISPSGARIAMEGASELPDTIVLAIGPTGRRYRARVAWRSEHEAGLCLLGEVAVAPPSDAT